MQYFNINQNLNDNFHNLNTRDLHDNLEYYQKLPDPAQNEPFNRATHPSDKPIISKHIFAVDSRQRDYTVYPNSNNYNVPIPDRYRNVTGIELKAATLPRCEYNVNSSNKYIDFNIGDYILSIEVKNNKYVTSSGKPYGEATGVFLVIDSPYLSTGIQAEFTVDIDKNSNIIPGSITPINQGSGYLYSKPPRVSIGDFTDFIVSIGKHYTATLREGQYVIGGNPQFTNKKDGTILQSWVPNNLLCELENAMSNAILNDTEHCYSRKPWLSESSNPELSTTDYPLLFNARLMSQYPSIDTYESDSRTQSNNFETNSCKFNRIYTTSSLIFKSKTLPVGPFADDNGFQYEVLLYDTIDLGTTINFILYCKLLNPLTQIGGNYWNGMSSASGEYTLAQWELLFASGNNQILNSATLFGFNKRNYSPLSSQFANNNAIEITHSSGTGGGGEITTLIPSGNTYTTENDYYIFGDPEYVILSFRPKYGGNSITGINDRVDSQTDSNINRVFACLIFDTVQPAVLQDVSSGKTDATIGSYGDDNNSLGTYMNYDKDYTEVKQLTGNSGSQNVNYNKPPGQLKAMKGADFDRKIVEFPQPIAQIHEMNIRFSKFSRPYAQERDEELYDFHGKEHLLLFEITCSDLMTGKRF